MDIGKLIKRGLLGCGMALLLAPAVPQATLAEDTVTQEIGSGGSLEASVTDVNLDPVDYSNIEQSSAGVLTLTVNDPRGSSAGWNVTISSGDFIYGGTSTLGDDIPASGFTFSADGTVSSTAGQAIGSGGPTTGTISGLPLSEPQMVISADAGFGSGTYSESLPVNLIIPEQSQAGTYVATLVVTISSGPGGVEAP